MDREPRDFVDGLVFTIVMSIGLWAIIYFVAADIAAWISGQPAVMVR